MFKAREPDWSFIQSDVDLKDVQSLEIKKPILLINEFIMRTTDTINTFAVKMESVVFDLESRLTESETQLDLMEAKLSSCKIETDDTSKTFEDTEKVDLKLSPTLEKSFDLPLPFSTPVDKNTQEIEESLPAATSEQPSDPPAKLNTMKISEHPDFVKYFKMLKLGIPEAAVRIKMSAEGFNPEVLADPNVPVPAVTLPVTNSSASDSSIGSSSDND